MGTSDLQKLSSDVMPHPKQANMLKIIMSYYDLFWMESP